MNNAAYIHRHTSWVEVDLDAIRHNFNNFKKTAGNAEVIAVVKSEAYGHGLEAVALTADEEGAWGFGIVSIAEGRRLRRVGITKPLVLIAPILPAQIKAALEADMRPAVFDLDFAKELSDCAKELGKIANVHIKVDTGMGRLSVPPEEMIDFCTEAAKLPNLKIEGIYSHLASADQLDQSYTASQYRKFANCIKELENRGINIPMRHLAASAGTILLNRPRFNLVRCGIALYGQWPSKEVRLIMASQAGNLQELANLQVTGDDNSDKYGMQKLAENPSADYLRPAMTFKTVVSQVKTLQSGSCISYGCTYMCHRPTDIAVLPIGYADGYSRALTGIGEVLIRGHRAPVVGRICMNICMVDVTDIPGVSEGDEVVLMGRQGSEYISADELADKLNTINYEIITRIPMHIPRFYLGRKPLSLAEQLEQKYDENVG